MGMMMLRSTMAAVTLAVAILASSCSDNSTDPTPQEFVADSADFVGYSSWEQTTEPIVGVDPAGILIGGAHGATDSNLVRSVFISPRGAKRGTNGEFPNGTLLLKELKDKDGNIMMLTSMAKRGGSFDPTGKNWEYFMMDGKGSIQGRGAGLMDGMCKGCHAGAASTDYVFTR